MRTTGIEQDEASLKGGTQDRKGSQFGGELACAREGWGGGGHSSPPKEGGGSSNGAPVTRPLVKFQLAIVSPEIWNYLLPVPTGCKRGMGMAYGAVPYCAQP